VEDKFAARTSDAPRLSMSLRMSPGRLIPTSPALVQVPRPLHKSAFTYLNVKPTVGFTLPWAGVTPVPSEKTRCGLRPVRKSKGNSRPPSLRDCSPSHTIRRVMVIFPGALGDRAAACPSTHSLRSAVLLVYHCRAFAGLKAR